MINYRGEWNLESVYENGDLVIFRKNLFVCSFKCSEKIPTDYPIFWDALTFPIHVPDFDEEMRGENGIDGKDGRDGIDGAHGKRGKDGRDGIDGIDGKAGNPGESFKWCGSWEKGQVYLVNDVVEFQGSCWIALKGNSTKPGKSSVDWELMVARGAKGERGDQGETGEKGEQGIRGDRGFPGGGGGNSSSLVEESDPLSLHLDFGNLPASPITSGFAENGNTLELWWNGLLVQSWTYTPVAADLTGQPWGLLLSLTHSS